MSRIGEILEEVSAALPPEAVSVDGAGHGRLTVDGVELTIVFEEDGSFFCSADVAGLDGVADQDLVLENALKANCFWNATRGSTLSVDPASGKLVLADRRESDFVENAEQLAAYLETFADVVARWREYVANSVPGGAPDADAPAAEENGNPGPEFRIQV